MKRYVVFLMAVLLWVLSCTGVSATQPLVADEAGLLTQQENTELSAYLSDISVRHKADIVVVTVESLNGYSAKTYADDYYDDNQYADDGILLLVAMQEREWYISTCGSCIGIVDYWGTDYLAEYFLSDLSSGSYYDAFTAFGYICDTVLERATQGDYPDPVYESSAGITGKTVLICLIIGLAVGLIIVFALRSQLKSVRAQGYAGSYVQQGSMALTNSRDIYLYRNVIRREKPKSNSSSGGGGRSHGGGGGRF